VIVFFASCSTQKNSLINREFHSLNTRYNVLFNGNEALEIGRAVLEQNKKDNFFELLTIEPISLEGEDFDSEASIPSFGMAEEKAVKAIQKHNMNIGGKQRNRQIAKSYLLLGKARYYDRRFLPALDAFNFLLEGFEGSKTFYEEKLWREKTNMRLNNNELAASNLRSIAINIPRKHKLFAEVNANMAQAFIHLKKYDSALVYLDRAVREEKNKALQARYSYIEAQLLERVNLLDSARQVYRSIVERKRKAPRIFWMQSKLQTFRLDALLDSISPLAEINQLSRAFENQTFLHLIYQQKARYLRSQKLDSLALVSYRNSNNSPYVDELTKRINYRELADYYFQKGNYLTTGNYLDSLLTQLSVDSKYRNTVQREREGLDQVIIYETTIQYADSVLMLASMNKKEQYAFFENQISLKRKKELEAIEKKKNNKLFRFRADNVSVFYFYNERLRITGKQDFLSNWGNRPNRDNWNRNTDLILNESQVKKERIEPDKKTVFFIETPEYLVSQIPTNQNVLDSLRKSRTQAYLDVGIVYKEKFKNEQLALNRFAKVLQNNPTDYQEESALYHTFKLLEKRKPIIASEVKKRLLESFPESIFSQIILNPDNQDKLSELTLEMRFNNLYQTFKNQQFDQVLNEGKRLLVLASGTDLEPKITFLLAHTIGRLEGEEKWKIALEEFVAKYPNSVEVSSAKKSLNLFTKEPENQKRVIQRYKWVFVLSNAEELDTFRFALEEKVKEERKLNWKVTRDVYNSDYSFIVIHTGGEAPLKENYLKKWGQLPRLEKVTNNFVLLSAQYEKIQREKKIHPDFKPIE
jgi:hypothetical protein